jgi:hypothetical protein
VPIQQGRAVLHSMNEVHHIDISILSPFDDLIDHFQHGYNERLA